MFFEFAILASTASGKSTLAHNLALKHKACILSLDSLCVYKEINIASAKPSLEQLNEVRYFGVNLLSVDEKFNVALFFNEYERAKAHAKAHNQALIIVGGTSFYLRALMQGLSQTVEDVDCKLSNDELFALVKKIDKNAKIEKNDTYRLKKWFSIYERTKEIPSLYLERTLKKALIEKLQIFDLNLQKDRVLNNIKQRTKSMIENGLIEEARALFNKYDANLKPLKSIGLKECKDFLDEKISKEKLELLINTHTAQLAKRQRTFNKKFSSTKINENAFEEISLWIEKLRSGRV